jgi:hypothetical protein
MARQILNADVALTFAMQDRVGKSQSSECELFFFSSIHADLMERLLWTVLIG